MDNTVAIKNALSIVTAGALYCYFSFSQLDCTFIHFYFTLICDLTLDKPPLPKKKISFRKTKVVDVNLLCDELSTTSLCTDSPDALNDLVKCYNSTLSAVLDRHAPLVTKFITARPLVPWFSDDIRESRRERPS